MNRESMGRLATLAFDTATEATAVAAVLDRQVIAESLDLPGEGERPRHGEVLLPAIEDVVERAGGWGRIDRIAVGTGPGAFTGLRIGLATATALAASAEVDVVGVSTLAALAAAAMPTGRTVAAVIDARRGEVFAALYEVGTYRPELLSGPAACRPDELAAQLAIDGRGVPAIGSGAVHFREVLLEEGFEVLDPGDPLHGVSAVQVANLGAQVADPAAARPEPSYLRPPDAQRWRQRDVGTSPPISS